MEILTLILHFTSSSSSSYFLYQVMQKTREEHGGQDWMACHKSVTLESHDDQWKIMSRLI